MAMATENVVLDRETDESRGGVWEGFKGLFGTGSEYADMEADDLRYERRLWDKRIESYLDSSLPDYLKDFGVLDEIALHVRDDRLMDLGARGHELIAFVKAFDEDLGQQEERIAAIEKVAKRKS